MNCSGCNAELKVGAAQCLECGQPVAVVAAPAGPVRDRSFSEAVNLAVRILKFEEPAVLEAAGDRGFNMMALVFAAFALAAPVVSSLGTAIFVAPFYIVATGVFFAAVHFAAKMLGGKGELDGFLRVQGLAMLVHWLDVVPVIGWMLGGLVGLFFLVLTVNNVRAVHKLGWAQAVVAMVLPGLILGAMICTMLFVFGVGLFAIAR